MALIDLDDIDDSYNLRVRDSLNTTSTTTNTANLTANLENVGNVDASTTGSHNADVGVTDSFNRDSHDSDTDLDVDIDDSFNDESDNSTDDHSDNSVDDHSDSSTNDSYNTWSDSSVNDSYNDNSQRWTDDHSVNVGNREFSLGSPVAGAASAAEGGGGGDVVFIDQSVAANVGKWGDFEQKSHNDAVVASGDGAMAAGDDIDIDQRLDESTNISGGGDVNVGNTVDMTTVAFSYNTASDSSTNTSTDIDVDIDDSWNDESQSFSADGSFTAELDSISQSDWDVDANVIWGSEAAIVVDDVSVDDAPDM